MSLATELEKDLREYSETIKSDCEKIAKEVQADMLAAIPSRTPVGLGNRNGHLKDGWVKGNIKVRDKDAMLYGVRSKNKPTVVHLVNFPHRIIALEYRGASGSPLLYRAEKGMTKGNPFVDEVQDEGIRELDERLRRYFNE